MSDGDTVEVARDGGFNIKEHDGDLVREAINRAEFPKQSAVGTVGGYEVLVVARVTEDGVTGGFTPKLTVHVDGEMDHGKYIGGSTITESYDRLWELDRAFGELLREHDLEMLEDGGDDV